MSTYSLKVHGYLTLIITGENRSKQFAMAGANYFFDSADEAVEFYDEQGHLVTDEALEDRLLAVLHRQFPTVDAKKSRK